jgi:hypothetical protein
MTLNLLTTLASVKSWAGVTTTNDDTLLSQLIGDTSRFILSYLQRPTLFQYLFSDVYDGTGGRRLILRHWPVISVALVMVDDISVPAQGNIPATGYVLEPWDGFPPGRPQAVSLRGYEYRRGYSNVSITYTAGFVVENEAQTVPSSGNYVVTVNAPFGAYGADQGVTYANGTALMAVASNPAQGQYAVNGGAYTFAGADAGAGVLISYSYVPSDVGHACMELVGERYRYKNRIGEVSKSLGGQETMAFSQKDMPDFIRTLLQPYRRVIQV